MGGSEEGGRGGGVGGYGSLTPTKKRDVTENVSAMLEWLDRKHF